MEIVAYSCLVPIELTLLQSTQKQLGPVQDNDLLQYPDGMSIVKITGQIPLTAPSGPSPGPQLPT